MSNEEREIRDYEDLNAHTALSLNKAQHRIEELEARLEFKQKNTDALVARWEPHIAGLTALNESYLRHMEAARKKVLELQAKLDAVQPLPDKWRKYTLTNFHSADCADELEEALGEAK